MPRRSADQLIADLEAKIQALRQKAEREKVKRDPALKHINAAVRAIDKAMESSGDSATKRALDDARTTLAACLSLDGIVAPAAAPRARRAAGGGRVDSEMLLAYVRANPAQRGEQIAEAMDTDTKAMRPVMKRLIEERKVRTKGERRGMTYAAV